MSVEPIRVELEAFCQQFTTALTPFSQALESGTDRLRQATETEALQAVLHELQDNRHRLKILLDRAQQQHTYLVIFGPLKSGKSTLMNAISGAYVSEVSSLPAYPCLVYVREGDSLGFSATAFNGDRSDFASRDELHSSLEKAHAALAREIRKAEADGRPFNPAEDYTEAVRRIDFTMPAPYLKESGTILVDTPGLYTKMKYNYGQLTRDFRDTAACAVFVVKADNLFFEQVFEEFADLLDVFSRVFLVVNIDSSKQDLGPDGNLHPALEQRDPKRIIEAFEDLTVSAQLREAIDSGRLRIYLIDLLRAAVRSLQDNSEDPGPSDAGQAAEVADAGRDETPDVAAPDSEAPVAASAPSGAESPEAGFDSFLGDLTEYLNSSEYIAEFMADSLRQALSILHEVKDQTQTSGIGDFRAGIEAIEREEAHARTQLTAIDQLRDSKWEGPLEELSREIWQQVTEHSGAVVPKLVKSLQDAVEAWRETDESVRELLEDRVFTQIREGIRASRQRAIELFDGACRARNGGVRLSVEMGRHLKALNLSFDAIYTDFQPTVRERFEAAPELPESEDLQDALPLRHRFVDWLLLRNEKRLRKHLLGLEKPSTKALPASVKAKRLDDAGIEAFCGQLGDYARRSFLETVEGELERLLRDYREVFENAVKERLASKRDEMQAAHAAAKEQLRLRKEVLSALEALENAADALEAKVTDLHQRFTPDVSLPSMTQPEENLEPESPDDET